ncbi:MAG: hypothetical protein QOG33_2479 [Gaiellales bacterium]|jgi:uncharacterized protein YbjQ (UPF0145 family)|nr:hypothetical protein [Gaiellales bacterium]
MQEVDDARARFATGDTKRGLKALDNAFYAIQRGSRDPRTAEAARQFALSMIPQLAGRDAKKAEDLANRFGVLARDYARWGSVREVHPSALSTSTLNQPLLPMSTLDGIYGHRISADLGIVSGFSVMSRNMFSDVGSDLQSAFGGRLGGIEEAIRTAHREAERSLSGQARTREADGIVGVRATVETVADKAQMVLLMGTAVKLVADVPAGD